MLNMGMEKHGHASVGHATRPPTSKRKQAAQIDLVLADVGLPKDVIVETPEEARKYRDVVGSIIYPALREGKVLYERAA